MKILSTKSSDYLPGVVLDSELGKFQFFGTSCPVEPHEFYDPIFEWFDEYLQNPLNNTVLDFKLDYFNTVSAKSLFRIMTKLEKLSNTGNDVKIRWFYNEEDFDQEEAGEEFGSILNVNFELVPIAKDNNDSDDAFFDNMMDDII